MKLELFYHLRVTVDLDEEVALGVLLTSDEDPGTPDEAAEKAGAAFDDWMAAHAAWPPNEDGGEEVWLEEGHVVTTDCESGWRVRKSFPIVRDDIAALARTGAVEGAGPPRGDSAEGEWLLSKRTGKWRLEKDLYAPGAPAGGPSDAE